MAVIVQHKRCALPPVLFDTPPVIHLQRCGEGLPRCPSTRWESRDVWAPGRLCSPFVPCCGVVPVAQTILIQGSGTRTRMKAKVGRFVLFVGRGASLLSRALRRTLLRWPPGAWAHLLLFVWPWISREWQTDEVQSDAGSDEAEDEEEDGDGKDEKKTKEQRGATRRFEMEVCDCVLLLVCSPTHARTGSLLQKRSVKSRSVVSLCVREFAALIARPTDGQGEADRATCGLRVASDRRCVVVLSEPTLSLTAARSHGHCRHDQGGASRRGSQQVACGVQLHGALLMFVALGPPLALCLLTWETRNRK